jgi:hypothetical protein
MRRTEKVSWVVVLDELIYVKLVHLSRPSQQVFPFFSVNRLFAFANGVFWFMNGKN